MLENPSHFVCDYSDLKAGHRIPGLVADAELLRRRLYFLLPIMMLYSVLLEDEMDALSFLVSKVMKNERAGHIGKVFPMFSESCIFPSEAKGFGDSTRYSKPGERSYSKQRSWRPALDTIVETPSRL
ncbi:hypothetical protein ACHQM5_014669 [Ranunculus cassubicifolius]